MRSALGTAGLGLALLLAGGLFDAEPLFVPGIAFLGLAALAAGLVAGAARGARVERILADRRAVEGEPLAMTLRAHSRLPLPGGALADPLLAEPVALAPGRRSARLRMEVRFGRRGRRVLAAPSLLLSDPLGLARRVVAGAHGDEVLVLPRTEAVRLPAAGDPIAAGAVRALVTPAGGTEVDGLRPYRPGAPAARIHWPAAARGAGLLERRLLPDGDGRPLLVLDARDPDSAEALDAAVRATASLCLELAHAGGCSVRLPGDRRATRVERDLRAWPGVWTRLALVEAGATPPPPLSGHAGPIFYVCARTGGTVPRALARAGGGSGPRVLVAPIGPGGPAPGAVALEVTGCRGHVLRAAARAA